ncbi:MAG: NAD(P)H-dependent oxidoreductase [Candidatus Saganbacteria bacterium]|nr:NAD(P)H-dependent oxidoreductase [Candidatus Saganbacteria bacterium]
MYIPIILGTAREGRQSEKVARFMLLEVKKAGLETELIDVRDYRVEATDNTETTPQAKSLGEKIKKADGLIVVSPEYNHGYPGELKMLLDMIYKQYAKKPLGICGVSAGGLGGARVVEQLRQVFIELRMVPIREALYFPAVQDLFDDKGNIKDPASYSSRVKSFLDELLFYASSFKKGE